MFLLFQFLFFVGFGKLQPAGFTFIRITGRILPDSRRTEDSGYFLVASRDWREEGPTVGNTYMGSAAVFLATFAAWPEEVSSGTDNRQLIGQLLETQKHDGVP